MPVNCASRCAPGHDVRHVHVVGREARLLECRGGLGVAVDALLPQDGHSRPRAARRHTARRCPPRDRSSTPPRAPDRPHRSALRIPRRRIADRRAAAASATRSRTRRVADPPRTHRALARRRRGCGCAAPAAARRRARRGPRARGAPGSRARAPRRRPRSAAPPPAPRRRAAPPAARPLRAGSRMSRPQWPANAISNSVASRPPSERSW